MPKAECRKRRALFAFGIWAVFCASSCRTTASTRLLALPDSAIHPAATIDGISEYGSAAATVMAVVQRDFGFRSFPVVFQFCRDAAAFKETLLDAGYDEALARDTSRTMQAVGGFRRVLLNEAALEGQAWPSRVAALAHEFSHSIQYEWGAGQRGASDQWLREGFAEWLAMQVIDRLKGLPLETARRRYSAMLRRATPSPERAPRFSEMVTFRQWVALGQRSDIAPYAQSFLAVDFLIERHGLAAVVDYFQRFARSSDRLANFRGAFGEDLGTFESAANETLWSTGRRQ